MSWGTVLSHTHIKNMLPDVQGEPPVFQCVPSPDEKPIMNTPTPNLCDKLNMLTLSSDCLQMSQDQQRSKN